MAAGAGSRLRPLTDHWPKPILPVDGRPVIATLLHELRAAGCTRVTVVTGHRAEQVESLLGDGSGFGVEVAYVRQPRPDGSADAVRRALAAGVEAPALVVGADTVFAPGSISTFVSAWNAAPGALAAQAGGTKAGLRIENGRVTKIVDPDTTELTSLPLWGLGLELVPLLADLSGPPFELKDAYERALALGLEVRGVVLPGSRDLTHPVDLISENFPYLTP